MSYYCGWDGGGTKTEVYCIDDTGACIADECFGPLNFNGVPRERVEQTVRDSLAFMNSLPGGLNACKALTIGMAGASNLKATQGMNDFVRAGGFTGKLDVIGDHVIALAGAIRGAGAVLVAGTGAVCRARSSSGESYGVGGYGYLIDDLGSGYAIGRDILASVARADDGRNAPTCFTDMVFKRLGITNIREMITWLYSPDTGKREVASLAPLLKEGLEAGDAAAQQIAEKAAHDLSELAITAWKHTGDADFELALTGSILNHYPTIRARVIEICQSECPGINIISPRHSPAYGAAMLAMENGR